MLITLPPPPLMFEKEMRILWFLRQRTKKIFLKWIIENSIPLFIPYTLYASLKHSFRYTNCCQKGYTQLSLFRVTLQIKNKGLLPSLPYPVWCFHFHTYTKNTAKFWEACHFHNLTSAYNSSKFKSYSFPFVINTVTTPPIPHSCALYTLVVRSWKIFVEF